jgi:hypothetical protein
MPAYLVRTIKKHDLVGVFFASNPLQLALLIDEVLDPEHCEYQSIGPGGVVWEKPAVEIPLPDQDEEDDTSSGDGIPWKDAAFTEMWSYNALYNQGRWRKIKYSLDDLYGIDPEAPDPEPPRRADVPPLQSKRDAKVLPFRKHSEVSRKK